VSQFPSLRTIEFDRCFLVDKPSSIELHGFSDASENAFGACIYIVSRNNLGDVKSMLICAKSKIAPIERQTLPRLELMGAVVLAELYQKVMLSLNLSINGLFLWSDSTILLCWLKKSEDRLEQFVHNRIVKIHQLTPNCIWHHVPTKSNPADLVSRGVFPQDIVKCNLWWHGPEFLVKGSD
jgi:hypothetical protein